MVIILSNLPFAVNAISQNQNKGVFQMNIPVIENVVYNGIQEGISYNLYIFTEQTTGSSFGIRTTTMDIGTAINKKVRQLIDSFK